MTQAQTFDALAFVKAKRAAEATGFDALAFVRRKRAEERAAPARVGIPDDGSGFVGEATKGTAKAGLQIAAGAAAGTPSVIEYLGEAVAGANALPMQLLGGAANMLGFNTLGTAYQNTAEAVASKGIDIARAARRGVAQTPIASAGNMTLPMIAQAPRAIAGAPILAPSDRAAADLAQMNNGTNFLPQTGAGWGSLTGEQLPALGLGLSAGLVGGPSLGVAVTGAAAGAQTYEATLAQLMQQYPGKSMDFYEGEAARSAIQSAMVESVTERLPMGEILEGRLAKMFVGKALSKWPRWARVLLGQTAKAGTSALAEGTEEVVSEGSGAVGDRIAGDPNAFDNLPRRMVTSGLIGGAMGAGMGGLTPGGFGAPVRPDPTTPPTDRMGGRGPTQQPTNRPQSPVQVQAAPTDTTLDDAAALAEQRLNERYNPAPVGQPSPADQSASSPTEQGNGDAEYEAAIQAIMAQRAERKAARQDTALQDEAVANIMERRNAARAERAAQATARTAQPPMRRVDRPAAPRVTLDPNAQVPTAPEPRRFTDRLTVPQRAPNAATPSTPTSARPASGSMEEGRTATGTEPGAGTSPSPALPGVQPPASSGQAPETGGSAVVGTSASPQSTREPWQIREDDIKDVIELSKLTGAMHLDEAPKYVESLRGKRIKSLRDGSTGTIRTVANTGDVVVHWDNEQSARDNSATQKTEKVKGARKPVQVWESWVGSTDQGDFVVEGMKRGPLSENQFYRNKGVAERRLKAGKPVPPEVLAEYGLKSPESPDSSNDSESPKGSTAKDTPKYGVYPQAVKGRGTMFAVRESDNPNGYGDTIHATREEAEKYAKEIEDRDRRNAESRERDRAAQEAKDREEAKRKAERENTRGFADSMPPMQRGKAIASLNTLVRVGGEADTIKSHVEKMVGAGGVELATREEPKIKPMGRTEYNRASQREQEAHEKRMKEAGTKTVYTVNGYDLGKTAFDYATFLKANPQPQGQVAATTNKEPKNGEEAKAPQAQVLNAGTAAPVSAGVVGAKTKAKATADDIPMDVANRAFSGTSHVPEKRARTWQSYYVNDFNNLAERFRKLADTDELRAALEEELTRFQEGLKSKYLAYLGAHSRVMSSMITGPARFPVEANRKRMDSADKRLAEIVEFVKRAEKAITRKLFPQASGVIRSDDENAPDALRAKIEGLQRRQEAMKDANKIIRKGGESAAMVPKLEALGFSNDEARRVLFPQFQRGMGFPGYALTNNSKNIRRLQERLTQIESQRAREPRTATFPGGGRVVENAEMQRVQIIYPDKPDDATLEKLKSRGFKWAPSQGAHQRLMNESAWRAAMQVTGATEDQKAPAQTENDDAIDPAEIAAEVARMKAMDPDTIPQENADGTGTGTTGGVGTARVNGPGNREGQQAEDAGDPPKDEEGRGRTQGSQGQVTGASESQIRAAKFKAAEDRKQQRKKDATAKGQATKAKYANNPPQFRASDIVKRLIDRAQNYPDLILDEMVQWGEDGSLLPISDISTTFVGKLPTELTHEFDAEPQIRSMLRVVPTSGVTIGGNGADWLSKLGVQKYADVLRAKFYSGEGKSRMGVDGALAKLKDFVGQDDGAKFLVWLHGQFKDAGANRPDWTVAKRADLKDGSQFSINGTNFEVMPDEEGTMFLRQRGDNFEAIDAGAEFVFGAIDEIPIDAGTLKQADNTGEVPDIAPEQVTTEGDDADAMLGRIKEQLDRGSGRQSADMIRAFQELGSTLVPGVRLQDAEEVGRMYAMLDDGTVTLAEYTNYIDDLRKSGKVAKPEPVAPTPEQATTEKPKFSDSEGVFGQKTESITGSQTSMFGNIAPDVTPDATRYPGIRSGETVAEYEKRMGTTDTPDMFGGPSSTGGDPRSPNYRPDLNDRISDALGRWSAAARSRFDDYMGKMQRGEILGSGPPITPMLDLAAHIAFKALQSGITSKSGRKLTAFIEGRMADIRAKWPQLNVTADTLRRQVRNMLAAADDDKTKIIPAYAAARDRVERVRTKEAGKTLDNPRAVREAVASATAERPDVAAKIIDVVKKGIRQGKEAGILTATAQLQPLIDRAKRATQASRRAREMGKIEARGAVESVKAEAEARAEERRGIRAEAVRLVQDTPIAGRGKYLSAVANAKTMKDLSKVLGRLRRDLAKSVGNQFAKVAAQLKKQERTLNEDRRLEATKAWAAVAANLDTIKNHKATTEELEQAAQNIREAAEALRSIFHSQKNADKVSILGRAITAQEHRDEMVKRLEMRKQLPQSDTPGQPRDKAWLRQKFDKFLNFHSMMMALDQEFYGNGPFARAWRAMSERRTAELAKNQEFADRADKIARKYGYKGLAEFIAKSSGALGDASQQWIDVELGDFKRITLGQALDIYARDAETREKMHKRQRFTFDPEGGSGSFIINDAKIAQIENALTKQQKQLAREMNRLRSEMQFDRMNETYKTLTGNYLVQVPEHYPIRRAMKLSESPDITKGLGEWTIKKMEEAGYLKQRVGGSAPIVIGDFATTQLRQFQMAEAFIQRGTIVKYLGATLLHPDVRVPIVQRHGTKIMDRVQQTISEFSGNESPQQDRMLRKLMSNVARAQTQVNIGTWARNMATAFNVPLAIVDGKMIGVRKTLRGILKALASPRKTMQILMRHSPDLRHRWSHAGASISLMHGTDVQASTDIADTAFSDAAKGTIRQILSAIKGIGAGKFLSRTADVSRPWNQLLDAIKLGNVFDGFGAMVAYHAVRADAPASLSPNAADKWAARRAAGIFAQTANTNDLLNSNEWQVDARRSTWTAGILAFTSDIAKKQNLLYLATKRGKKATAYATAAVTLGALWSTAITAAISAAVGDDEDKIKKRAAEGMAKELVSLMPAGTLTSNVLEMVMNPRGSSGILDTPLTAVSKNVLAAVKKFADAADDGEEADVFEGAYRVLRVLNDVTGAPIGPTAGMVKRAIVNYGTE